MPRTKQTAKKSTGAHSQRVILVKPQSIKNKKLQTQTAIITPKADPHDVWCCGCGNGGELTDCSFCLRTTCNACVRYHDPNQLAHRPEVQFRCVYCHLTSKDSKKAYYPFFKDNQAITSIKGYITATPIRANYPRMNTESIAIIELRLSTITANGSPFLSVTNDLSPYFTKPHDTKQTDDRKVYQSVFLININTDSSKSLEAHQKKLGNYVKELIKFGVKRLLVFVYTHCNPDNGDLHCADGVGIEVNDFLQEIVGPDLNSLAKETHSLLVLNVCGGIWTSETSSEHLKAYAQSGQFKHVIGFTGKDFFPHLAATFLSKLVRKTFIECFSTIRALSSLLDDETELGAHTPVVLLAHKFGVSFFWCHGEFRPWGDKIPLQCPGCDALKTLVFKEGKNRFSYRIRCEVCKWKSKSDILVESAVFPKGKKNSVTGWGQRMIYGEHSDVDKAWGSRRTEYENN